ncbi:MAG TPA: hypothetical protein VFV66_17715 [Nonomuraea sp.]|nr:hypothetical protein [Nonomuraea sp.]
MVTAVAVARPPTVASTSSDVPLAHSEQPDALRNATSPAPDLDKVTVTRDHGSARQQGMRPGTSPYASKAGSVAARVRLNAGGATPDAHWTTRTYLHVSAANGSTARARVYAGVWDENGRCPLRSIWAEPHEHQVVQIRVEDLRLTGQRTGVAPSSPTTTNMSGPPPPAATGGPTRSR